ncbi:MAG: phosphoadenylyl-sulfate reductase [Phycisphaerae bacterium]
MIPMHDLADMVRRAASLDAEGLLALAVGTFAGRVALATSLGAEDQVLTDMLARHSLNIAVFTLDTGRLPQETYDLIDATRKRYGIAIEVLFPDLADVEQLVARGGVNLFYGSTENRKACCHARKVLPLRRRLVRLDAWITGLRREQSITRQDIARVEWDEAHGLVKINPLADWTGAQVWDYIRRHDVPYSALHDKGYPSIGCAPCTRAVAPGQDARAGRWWWELPDHKECGLHYPTGAATKAALLPDRRR